MKDNILKAVLVINIFDILLHVIINQPELLRIIGNLIVILCALVVIRKYKVNSQITLFTSAILNLLLNIFFIVNNGIGVLGVIFIATTTILVTICAIKFK